MDSERVPDDLELGEDADAMTDILQRIGPIQDDWLTPDGAGAFVALSAKVARRRPRTWQAMLRRLMLAQPDDVTGEPTETFIYVERVPDGARKDSDAYRQVKARTNNINSAIRFRLRDAAKKASAELGREVDWKDYLRASLIGTTIRLDRALLPDGTAVPIPEPFVRHAIQAYPAERRTEARQVTARQTG